MAKVIEAAFGAGGFYPYKPKYQVRHRSGVGDFTEDVLKILGEDFA